jgi:hypothetical protein
LSRRYWRLIRLGCAWHPPIGLIPPIVSKTGGTHGIFNRSRGVEHLWGFCRSCYYAEACRGGCTWTADSLLGRRGNNPYCHHRVLQLTERGIRERIVKVEDTPSLPFATGRFSLIEEPIPAEVSCA